MNAALAHPLYLAVKSALAALLALVAVELLGLPDRLSATFVACVCITPTAYAGLRRGLDQLMGSAIGGGLSWLTFLWVPRAAAIGLSLFWGTLLTFGFGFARGWLVAAFSVLYVLLIPGPDPATVLELRMASVAIGVLSATAVNLVVSRISYRGVFTRRLAIARRQVAGELRLLSEQLRGPVVESQRRRLFEESFPLLRHLFEELADGLRETGLLGASPALPEVPEVSVAPDALAAAPAPLGSPAPARARRSTREELISLEGAAHHLLAVAHYGKDVALQLARDPGPYPAGAEWAAALADALELNQLFDPWRPLPEPALHRALESAAEAWSLARSGGG
jgi:hypothetical protein